jgi:hypothetical protein
LQAKEVSPSPSRTIALLTPASGVALPELQPASAAPVERRQVYAGLAEPPESAAATAREEPRARAAKLTRMAADPSRPEQEAWSVIGLAILIPRVGFQADYHSLAVEPGRSERGSR